MATLHGGSVDPFEVSSAACVECSSDCNGAITGHGGILGGGGLDNGIAMDDDEESPTTHGPPHGIPMKRGQPHGTPMSAGVSGWSPELG